MLFNSPEFIFVFLPVTAVVYFLLSRSGVEYAGRIWLVLASLAFYSFWGFAYLPLLLLLIVVNYIIGTTLIRLSPLRTTLRKTVLILGIVFDVAVLGYYKYANFIVDTVNQASGSDFFLEKIALPLAISFVTFQKIAYLVDCYRGLASRYNVVNYSLFATFFPQLIAGPIVHHSEIVPQFEDRNRHRVNWDNVALGLAVFALGLGKKVLIADQFAVWANAGYATTAQLAFVEAWRTSLSYTFQLYFDFSGYVDMATGSALIFNIRLPINFNSPYKSLDIQDFWRRWHMTLGRFLRDYVYIPLGGNKRGSVRTYFNLFLTFVIGGIWHGAGWMFVIWGALHGGALIVHRLWTKVGGRMPAWLAWFITFNFVNLGWVFFRAPHMDSAIRVLRGMASPFDGSIQQRIATGDFMASGFPFLLILAALIVCVSMPNAFDFARERQRALTTFVVTGLAFGACTLVLLAANTLPAEFLYFNF